MKLTEITPQEMACVIGACPAVFVSEDQQQIVLIGRKTPSSELAHRVAADEELVSISREMLEKALQSLRA